MQFYIFIYILPLKAQMLFIFFFIFDNLLTTSYIGFLCRLLRDKEYIEQPQCMDIKIYYSEEHVTQASESNRMIIITGKNLITYNSLIAGPIEMVLSRKYYLLPYLYIISKVLSYLHIETNIKQIKYHISSTKSILDN